MRKLFKTLSSISSGFNQNQPLVLVITLDWHQQSWVVLLPFEKTAEVYGWGFFVCLLFPLNTFVKEGILSACVGFYLSFFVLDFLWPWILEAKKLISWSLNGDWWDSVAFVFWIIVRIKSCTAWCVYLSVSRWWRWFINYPCSGNTRARSVEGKLAVGTAFWKGSGVCVGDYREQTPDYLNCSS